MNWEARIKQQEAEAHRLERLGWAPIPGIHQSRIGALSNTGNKAPWPEGSVYHWTTETVYTPPSKE